MHHQADLLDVLVALRLTCYTRGELSTGLLKIPAELRSRGAFTGTRIAGVYGRIPIVDAINNTHTDMLKFGLKTDNVALTVSTWVDNVYSVGHSAQHQFAYWSLLNRSYKGTAVNSSNLTASCISHSTLMTFQRIVHIPMPRPLYR